MGVCRKHRALRSRLVGTLALLLLSSGLVVAGPVDRFPEARPATFTDAVTFVAGSSQTARHSCLTARSDSLRLGPYGTSPAARRALALLHSRPATATETLALADGLVLRFAPATLGSGGSSAGPRPELTEALRRAAGQVRTALADHLGLAVPDVIEVVLLDLGGEPLGFLVSVDQRTGRAVLALDTHPTRNAGDPRRALIHQYAHAVAAALGSQFPVDWGEAFATWAEIAIDGPSGETAAAMSRRFDRLNAGMFSGELALAAGNAAWFSFLDEAYGPRVLRAAVRELAGGPPAAAAMDRALRATSADDLRGAFREFHLWALLTGDRTDRFHFSFASDLTDPQFASSTDGLPALSVHADPAIAAWGAAQVLLRPGDARGGMRVLFEGEFPGRWEVDLLLVGHDATKRRVPIEISSEGRGATTVPVDDVAEAFLMLRNVAGEQVPARRYTYAVESERDYPFEIVSFEAAAGPSGVGLTWETATEQDLVGFNVLRKREVGGPVIAINPVWVPALGDRANATTYHYVDAAAEPGVAYVYRVQGITTGGLTRQSEPVSVRLAIR